MRDFPGQWLRLQAFTAEGASSIPGQELRSHMLLQPKIKNNKYNKVNKLKIKISPVVPLIKPNNELFFKPLSHLILKYQNVPIRPQKTFMKG